MSQINIGDVVTIKSAPENKMTVGKTYTENGEAYTECYWYIDGEIKKSHLPVSILEKDGNS